MDREWEDVTFSKKDRKKEHIPSEIRQALRRIGMTDDGKKLTEFLYNAYIFNKIDIGASDGALREFAATQRLARRICILLQSEPNDRTSDRDNRPTWIKRILRIAGRPID